MRPGIRLAAVLWLLVAGAQAGTGAETATDANIVTGIDLSESVGAAEIRLEVEGMAAALRAPALLAAVQSGRHAKVGFAVFAWYHGNFLPVVPWRTIGSAADAEAAAAELALLAEADIAGEAWTRDRFYAGRLTNLAGAMDHAGELLAAAPYPTGRRVANLVGNGADNVGGDVVAARSRLAAQGITVNAVAVGGDAEVAAYFRSRVAAGPGSFVLATASGEGLAEAMLRKFLGDLVVAAR